MAVLGRRCKEVVGWLGEWMDGCGGGSGGGATSATWGVAARQ